MPSYGGSNGPDGSKKSGDQGQGSRDRNGGQTGGGRGNDKGQTKSLGRRIADLFGGLQGYQNNPNRPNYDTKTMGPPISISPSSLLMGQNLGMSPGASAAVNAVTSLMSGIGPAMGATRAIQAATGRAGGPAIGGRNDGNTSFGGGGSDQEDTLRTGAKPKKKTVPAATTLAPAGEDWTNGRNPDATKLLLDQILSQSLNPSASQVLLGA